MYVCSDLSVLTCSQMGSDPVRPNICLSDRWRGDGVRLAEILSNSTENKRQTHRYYEHEGRGNKTKKNRQKLQCVSVQHDKRYLSNSFVSI